MPRHMWCHSAYGIDSGRLFLTFLGHARNRFQTFILEGGPQELFFYFPSFEQGAASYKRVAIPDLEPGGNTAEGLSFAAASLKPQIYFSPLPHYTCMLLLSQ